MHKFFHTFYSTRLEPAPGEVGGADEGQPGFCSRRMTRPAAPPGVHSREDEKTGAVPYGRSR